MIPSKKGLAAIHVLVIVLLLVGVIVIFMAMVANANLRELKLISGNVDVMYTSAFGSLLKDSLETSWKTIATQVMFDNVENRFGLQEYFYKYGVDVAGEPQLPQNSVCNEGNHMCLLTTDYVNSRLTALYNALALPSSFKILTQNRLRQVEYTVTLPSASGAPAVTVAPATSPAGPGVTREITVASKDSLKVVLNVKLNVVMGSADRYIIEERFPAGSIVLDIGAGGERGTGADSGLIKWICIQGCPDTVHTYSVSVPSGAETSYAFSGNYSTGKGTSTTAQDERIAGADTVSVVPAQRSKELSVAADAINGRVKQHVDITTEGKDTSLSADYIFQPSISVGLSKIIAASVEAVSAAVQLRATEQTNPITFDASTTRGKMISKLNEIFDSGFDNARAADDKSRYRITNTFSSDGSSINVGYDAAVELSDDAPPIVSGLAKEDARICEGLDARSYNRYAGVIEQSDPDQLLRWVEQPRALLAAIAGVVSDWNPATKTTDAAGEHNGLFGVLGGSLDAHENAVQAVAKLKAGFGNSIGTETDLTVSLSSISGVPTVTIDPATSLAGPGVTREITVVSKDSLKVVLNVKLNVVMGSADRYIIEERFPAGSTVLGIDAEGERGTGADSGLIKWICIQRCANIAHTYSVSVPSGAETSYGFSGNYSTGKGTSTTAQDERIAGADTVSVVPVQFSKQLTVFMRNALAKYIGMDDGRIDSIVLAYNTWKNCVGVTDLTMPSLDASNVNPNRILNPQDYARFLSGKNPDSKIFLGDDFCSASDYQGRGYRNLAYDFYGGESMAVYPAYSGTVIDVVGADKSWDGCNGAVWVQTGDFIISYEHISPAVANGATVGPNRRIGFVFTNHRQVCLDAHLQVMVYSSKWTVPAPGTRYEMSSCGTKMSYERAASELEGKGQGDVIQTVNTSVVNRHMSAIEWEGLFRQYSTGRYWRLSNRNEWATAPVSMSFKMTDSFNALSCSDANEGMRYRWQNENDLLCSGGKLVSCDADVAGIRAVGAGETVGGYKCVEMTSFSTTTATADTPLFAYDMYVRGKKITKWCTAGEEQQDWLCCGGIGGQYTCGMSYAIKNDGNGDSLICGGTASCSVSLQGPCAMMGWTCRSTCLQGEVAYTAHGAEYCTSSNTPICCKSV